MTRALDAGKVRVVRAIENKDSGHSHDPSLDEYFLASRSLPGRSVASLLLSSSFGVNAIFYATSLGYILGGWAFLIQIGWAVSFFLLSLFSSKIYGVTSLHDLLGQRFGRNTQIVASFSSIIGLLYLVGWEISIGVSSVSSLAVGQTGTANSVLTNAGLLVGAAVLVATAYTVFRGQQMNARVDLALNLLKTVAIVVIVALLLWGALRAGGWTGVTQSLFPSFSSSIAALGIIGFVTSILFNVSWQFVDNSSWQSINSRKSGSDREVKNTLHATGVVMLLTIGLFGTLLGALMRDLPNVDSNAILAAVVQGVPSEVTVVALICMTFLILMSVMSLVDGMILSVAQTALVDLRIASRFLRRVRLRHARAATIAAGLVAGWGVNTFISALGGSIFSFVYVLIVVQLSLLGPVLVALCTRRQFPSMMWLSIMAGSTVGTASAIVGTKTGVSELVDGAGTLASVISVTVAFLTYAVALAFRRRRGPVPASHS